MIIYRYVGRIKLCRSREPRRSVSFDVCSIAICIDNIISRPNDFSVSVKHIDIGSIHILITTAIACIAIYLSMRQLVVYSDNEVKLWTYRTLSNDATQM